MSTMIAQKGKSLAPELCDLVNFTMESLCMLAKSLSLYSARLGLLSCVQWAALNQHRASMTFHTSLSLWFWGAGVVNRPFKSCFCSQGTETRVLTMLVLCMFFVYYCACVCLCVCVCVGLLWHLPRSCHLWWFCMIMCVCVRGMVFKWPFMVTITIAFASLHQVFREGDVTTHREIRAANFTQKIQFYNLQAFG